MVTGMPAMSSESMVGAVFSSRYRLLRLIAEGGLAAVFEAQDLSGSGRCALKVLRSEYAADRRVVAQFYGGAEVAARLAHPNIARCFGHAPPEEPSPYVVNELVEGTSVASYLRPGLAYEAQIAVPIVRALLSALAEAHRQGVVHGDIKPGNVFLTPRADGPPMVKVLDFGIARAMDAAGGMMTRTRSGAFLGSSSYMSPEQIRNAREIGPPSDLWSVAILLYQLLAGREPFIAQTEAAKLTLVLSGEPPSIAQGKPELAGWRVFFGRALAREAEHRFASAAEMDAAIVEAAGAAARGALGVSVTDMSPQLAQVVARGGAHAQIEVLRTPVRPPASERGPRGDSTLRAGEVPMLAPQGSNVPMWIAVVVATICLAAGFLAGFVVARL
ncbi:MAG TPA: serine/threonine-protein kinase [Polyangiaceae bacterium]|nr:serine/threonine-protein kinase [Polyangiaceae bacterium]